MTPLKNQRSLFEEAPEAGAIRFFVPGVPQPRGSKTAMPLYRNGKLQFDDQGKPIIRIVDSCKLSGAWMQSIRLAASQAVGPTHVLWGGPVSVEAEFRFKRPRSHYTGGWDLRRDAPVRHDQTPDVDKLVRSVLDSLSKIVYLDDSQVWILVNPRKVWTGTQAGALVVVQRAP
jgi:Holliday junction resolvase RusA-like endonuclease